MRIPEFWSSQTEPATPQDSAIPARPGRPHKRAKARPKAHDNLVPNFIASVSRFNGQPLANQTLYRFRADSPLVL